MIPVLTTITPNHPLAIIRLFAEAPQTFGVISIVHAVLLRDDPTSTPNDVHQSTKGREMRKRQTTNRQPYKTQITVQVASFYGCQGIQSFG